MTTIAQLTAIITANTSGFTKGVQATQTGIQSLAQQAGSASSGIGQSFNAAWASVASGAAHACASAAEALSGVESKLSEVSGAAQKMGQDLSLAVTAPITGIIGTALAFDDLTARAQIGFTAIIGNAQLAKSTIDDLQKMAVATPFDFSGLLGNAQSLLAMGFTAKEILPDIQAIGDAVAKTGQGQDAINHATLALSEMRAEANLSSVQMRELVMGAKIPAWDLLGQAMHKTTSELRDMTEKGLIPGKYAAAALLYEMEKTSSGAMTKLGGTLMAAGSNLKDAATQALGSIFEPLYQDASKVANQVANILMQIKGYVVALPESLKQKIGDMLIALAAAGPALLIVAGLAKALALLASPLGIAAAALAYGTYWLLQHRQAAQQLGEWIQSRWSQIWTAATAVLVTFATVGVARVVFALQPLGAAAIQVTTIVIRAFAAMAVAVAAAMGVSVATVAFSAVAIVAALALLYEAWNNNWLHFKDVVDFVFRYIAAQVDSFLGVLQLIPGAVGQMAQAVQTGFDVFGQATNNFDSAKIGGAIGQNLTEGFKGALGGLPKWMTGLFQAPDITGLMKQISAVKMPSMNVAAPAMPNFQAAASKDAAKAAKKLQDIYDSQLESLNKATFLIGKNGKLADVQADILYGDLGKLNGAEKSRLLTLAAQYDALEQQHKVAELIQKASDNAFVASLPKWKQAVIEAAGGFRDWLKLSQAAQDSLGANYGIQKQNEAMLTGRGIVNQLTKDIIGLGFNLTHVGQDAAQSLGIQAAGGAEAFGRMLNIAGKNGRSLAENISSLAATKEYLTSATSKIKELSDQAWTSGAAFHTAAEEVDHFFASLQQQTGAAAGISTILAQMQAEGFAKTIDQNGARKQLSDWGTDLAAQIAASRQKIAGTYDPAKAAVADWMAANKEAIDRIVASGGTIKGVIAQVSQAFTLNAQAEAAEKIRDMIKETKADFAQMTAKNPFDAWKVSLGPLPGIDDNQLKKLFDFQEKVQLAKDAAAGIRDTIVGAFNDAFQNGAKTFFSSVVSGFDKMLQQMALNYLSSQLMGLLTRTLGGVFAGGGGGLFGTIASAVTGSAGTAASSAASSAAMNTGSSLFGGISQTVSFAGARAGGGPVLGGAPYLVGEKGPELFVPPMSGGSITPSGKFGGGSSDNYNISVTVPSSGGNPAQDRRSGQQIGQAIFTELQRNKQRNGK